MRGHQRAMELAGDSRMSKGDFGAQQVRGLLAALGAVEGEREYLRSVQSGGEALDKLQRMVRLSEARMISRSKHSSMNRYGEIKP